MDEREFIFDTFDEAMNIHRELFKRRRLHGVVTCADIFCLRHANEEIVVPDILYSHGWTNLWGSKVEPYGDDGQWILKMPPMKFIDKNLLK